MAVAQRVVGLKKKLDQINTLSSPEIIRGAELALQKQIMSLEDRLTKLKIDVQQAEMRFGIFQFKLPANVNSACAPKAETPTSKNFEVQTPQKLTPQPEPNVLIQSKPKSSEPKKPTENAKGSTISSVSAALVDMGRLDMRVGRIMEIAVHPDASNSYVEKVDLGEGHLRTVVSCLVKYVPIESLQNRMGVFMCNLKPLNVRGVLSEAMLMCASAPEEGNVEPLVFEPAEDLSLGDSIVVPGCEHNPDAQLNPKKKIFEQIKPDLRVDASGFATYKAVPWTLKQKTNVRIKAVTLRDVAIA